MNRIVPEKETITVEFKSDQPKKLQDSDIFDAVVAFANSDGGDLFLGVEDDGRVTGVHKDHGYPRASISRPLKENAAILLTMS
ncbi:MAG: ATP-binding protein [Clostridia bacterium]|nr:ATP-binding protein [Clostridia bacterium]